MSSTRKRTAKKQKKIRKTNKRHLRGNTNKRHLRGNTNKRHKIRKTKNHIKGGSADEDFIRKLKEDVPIFFREQLQKECESGDNLNKLNKLKCNFTRDILEEYIEGRIQAFNRASVDWLSGYDNDMLWNKVETTIPYKWSCSFIREIYGSLIGNVIDEWIHITDGDTAKTKGLGASYIRWVLRVTVRRFTNTKVALTKAACDPSVLEKRDMAKYNCEKDKLCPSEEYLIDRLKLSGVDANDDRWLKLVDSSRRDNETYNTAAQIGKHFGV